ncbi:hypothetical protein PspLS_09299 [Pyricularia sp. CBS 133598]|nr:hypothetical protein PspLS_09299 [Pyricularia sp. CBS 133598]
MHIDLEERVQTWCAGPQLQSLLFTKLPPEIRHETFAFALAPHEIITNSWHKYEFAEDCADPPDFRLQHGHDGELDEDEASLTAAKASADTYRHTHPEQCRRLLPPPAVILNTAPGL